MRNGRSSKLLPVVRFSKSHSMTFPAGKRSGANSAPTARTNTPVLDVSCPTAAGLVGETIVTVSEPHVTRSTKPVLVSADAPAAPRSSVAATAASGATTARLSVLNDRANDPGRGPESVTDAPFHTGALLRESDPLSRKPPGQDANAPFTNRTMRLDRLAPPRYARAAAVREPDAQARAHRGHRVPQHRDLPVHRRCALSTPSERAAATSGSFSSRRRRRVARARAVRPRVRARRCRSGCRRGETRWAATSRRSSTRPARGGRSCGPC
jgi:hypothetical protein